MAKFSSVIILIAGVLWGMLGIFVSALRDLGFSSIQAAALRWMASAVMIVAIVAIYDRKKLKISPRDIWMFAFVGICSSLAMSSFYFVCMELTSIAVSDVLMYTAPIWIMIFSAVLFKEKITARKALCMVLAFSGCAFVSGIVSGGVKGGFLGITCGLLSGIAYALYSIAGTFILKKYDKLTLTAYNMVFAAIGSFFIINVPKTFGAVAANPSCIKQIVFLAVLGTILPYFLYTYALKHTKATKASVLCCIEPVSAALISVFYAGETLEVLQIAGIALIILAIVMLQIKKSND